MSETASGSASAAERILRERARKLARPHAREAAAREADYVVFELGGELYALDAAAALAVTPVRNLSALPGAEAGVRGLIAWRGRLLPALDLRAGLGLSGAGFDDLRYAIVIGAGDSMVAVLAARGLEVTRRDAEAFTGAPTRGAAGLATGVAGDGTVRIDAGALLRRYG